MTLSFLPSECRAAQSLPTQLSESKEAKDMSMLNAAMGQLLKQRGMQLALDYSGDWSDRVLAEFKDWLDVQRSRGLAHITIEEFRSQAVSQPAKPQAWGSMPRLAMSAGLIKPKMATPTLQDRVPSASPRTHGHPVLCWLIVQPVVRLDRDSIAAMDDVSQYAGRAAQAVSA